MKKFVFNFKSEDSTKLINSKNKTNIYLLYSRLINKIDVSIKYNLDLNNLFFEINKKYLDAK